MQLKHKHSETQMRRKARQSRKGIMKEEEEEEEEDREEEEEEDEAEEELRRDMTESGLQNLLQKTSGKKN